MSSAKSSAESTAEKAEQLLITKARAVDVTYSKYFAAGILANIAIFTIINWSRIGFNKYGGPERTILAQSIAHLSRSTRRFRKGYVIGGILILPDRVYLACVYFGINLTWMFTNIDISLGTMFTKRCGWLMLCNLCLVVFLGLKNTPLSPLAGRSYESINVLHRCCGYTTILLTMLHALNVIAGLAKEHVLVYLMEPGQCAGIVGALGLLIIGLSANRSFRKRQYEVFYLLHVALVTMILVTSLLHVEKISWSAIAIVIFVASLWFTDRSLRLSRWIYNGYGNNCMLTPLPQGATRVVMQGTIKAQPGSHVFLWIPRIRKFQTHPFTLVSNDPAEFVISAQNGFTRALHEFALQHPHQVLRAAIEGPYGSIPDTSDFDKVVLLSGGSGITFTLALAMDWLKTSKKTDLKRSLYLVWAVKTESHLRWFDSALKELQRSPLVNLQVHVTAKETAEANIFSTASTPPGPESSGEKTILYSPEGICPSLQKAGLANLVAYGRPNVHAVIKDAVDGMSPDREVLIAGCGPSTLLNAVRLATRACTTDQSPNIQLHLEELGW